MEQLHMTEDGQARRPGSFSTHQQKADDETIDLYDQACAAYALYSGVRLLRVRWANPYQATYEFENRNGLAAQALQTWRRGTAQVAARDYIEHFRAIQRMTKMARPTAVGEVVADGARTSEHVA